MDNFLFRTVQVGILDRIRTFWEEEIGLQNTGRLLPPDIRPQQYQEAQPPNLETPKEEQESTVQLSIVAPMEIFAYDDIIPEVPGADSSNDFNTDKIMEESSALVDESRFEQEFQYGQDRIFFQPLNITHGEIMAPIEAGSPKILRYHDGEGEVCSAVALTRPMLYRWKEVMQGEDIVKSLKTQIDAADYEIEMMSKRMAEIGQIAVNLPQEATADIDPVKFLQEAIVEMEILESQSEKLKYQKEILEERLKKACSDLNGLKRILYRYWKQTLGENGLLEDDEKDQENTQEYANAIPVMEQYPSQENIQADQDPIPDMAQHPYQGPLPTMQFAEPTPSEIEQRELEEAQEAARDIVHNRQCSLLDARMKIDNWEPFYDEQYQRYREWVSQGNKSDKTNFDRNLLQNQMECIQKVRQAEEALNAAREHAKYVGLFLYAESQESGFVDDVNDGYRESLEAQIIAQCDREAINRWLDNEQSEKSADCDEWQMKEVDVSDSVSLVALGKDRRRIDTWRSLCDELPTQIPEDMGEQY